MSVSDAALRTGFDGDKPRRTGKEAFLGEGVGYRPEGPKSPLGAPSETKALCPAFLRTISAGSASTGDGSPAWPGLAETSDPKPQG